MPRSIATQTVRRPMKTRITPDPSFEFFFPELDTSFLGESDEDKVIVRAPRNIFSNQRKANFPAALRLKVLFLTNFRGFQHWFKMVARLLAGGCLLGAEP